MSLIIILYLSSIKEVRGFAKSQVKVRFLSQAKGIVLIGKMIVSKTEVVGSNPATRIFLINLIGRVTFFEIVSIGSIPILGIIYINFFICLYFCSLIGRTVYCECTDVGSNPAGINNLFFIE